MSCSSPERQELTNLFEVDGRRVLMDPVNSIDMYKSSVRNSPERWTQIDNLWSGVLSDGFGKHGAGLRIFTLRFLHRWEGTGQTSCVAEIPDLHRGRLRASDLFCARTELHHRTLSQAPEGIQCAPTHLFPAGDGRPRMALDSTSASPDYRLRLE